MGATQYNSRLRRENRPLLPEAPAWFNQARARANQRQTFRPRPAPLANRRPWISRVKDWLPLFRKNAMPVAALLVALPTMFCAGFWMRGAVSPAQSAGRQAMRSDDQRLGRVQNERPEQHGKIPHFAPPQVVPAGPAAAPQVARAAAGDMPREALGVASEARPRHSKPAAPRHEPARRPKVDHLAIQPAADSEGTEPDQKWQPASGFELTPPGEATLVADVRRPGNSWFESAADEAPCRSGLCAPPQKKPSDRKLNTALVWSSSPEAAADEARRDGKLVFLIHVSGNFAQPGFT